MIRLQGRSRIMTRDETLTVRRYGDVQVVDAKPVRRFREKFEIRCNVQPVEGRDLLLVPEWDRFKEQYWLFSSDMTHALRDNDIVQRPDPKDDTRLANYQAQNTQNWGSFQECRIVRVDVGPEATP